MNDNTNTMGTDTTTQPQPMADQSMVGGAPVTPSMPTEPTMPAATEPMQNMPQAPILETPVAMPEPQPVADPMAPVMGAMPQAPQMPEPQPVADPMAPVESTMTPTETPVVGTVPGMPGGNVSQ